ncbi:MAG TPA: hypothetical protein VHL30_01210 [Chlamydiales bacterium]|jgi:hypothetical protein|nr:hypothetical protein [Chlamydiales bacterium]
MANGIQLKTEQAILNEAKPLSYLENIVHKKVNNVALTCFECVVHWFLTTALVSCFYPAYDRLYKAEVAKLSAGNGEPGVPLPRETTPPSDSANPEIASRSLPITPTKEIGNPQNNSPDLSVSLTMDVSPEETNNADNTSILPTDGPEKTPEVSAPGEIAPPVVTQFLRGGELHDYTAKKIAGLRINRETHYRDGKPYQYLTLNSYKVLLYGEGPRHDRNNNHFPLPYAEDRVIVRDSVEDPGKIEIVEFDSLRNRNSMLWSVDPAKLYLRIFENADGDEIKEHVYLTHVAEAQRGRPPGYLIFAHGPTR